MQKNNVKKALWCEYIEILVDFEGFGLNLLEGTTGNCIGFCTGTYRDPHDTPPNAVPCGSLWLYMHENT